MRKNLVRKCSIRYLFVYFICAYLSCCCVLYVTCLPNLFFPLLCAVILKHTKKFTSCSFSKITKKLQKFNRPFAMILRYFYGTYDGVPCLTVTVPIIFGASFETIFSSSSGPLKWHHNGHTRTLETERYNPSYEASSSLKDAWSVFFYRSTFLFTQLHSERRKRHGKYDTFTQEICVRVCHAISSLREKEESTFKYLNADFCLLLLLFFLNGSVLSIIINVVFVVVCFSFPS